MITVDEALQRILTKVSLLPSETVSLTGGLGRVLARDHEARRSQPPCDVSAMDGYAVRAADVVNASTILELVGESAAGSNYEGKLSAGETVRTFTGAAVPDGADAIVIQEDVTALDNHRIEFQEPAQRGRHIRLKGIDFLEGDAGLAQGRRLTALDLGLAAAMDLPWLEVIRKPKISILATGDELAFPGELASPDQIISSTPYALAAYIAQWGGNTVQLGIARDNEQSLKRAAAGAHGTDLLVTIGGASVGDHDLVRDVLSDMGMTLEFWRVAMRPGKPMMFGDINGTPLLGLPGNPVSCLVCALLFLKPIVAMMLGQGKTKLSEMLEPACIGKDLPANGKRQDYMRAALERDASGQLVATPYDLQDSSVMSLLAAAGCLVVRPPFAAEARQGESVEILRL